MADRLRIPANSRARLMAVHDEAQDKCDVVDFGYEFLDTSPPPSTVNLLKIPANSQAYLTAVRDEASDACDAIEMAYDYLNAAALPEPWAYWKMEEASGTRVDSTTHARDLTPAGHALPTNDAGKIGNAAKNLSDGVSPGPRFAISAFPTINGNQPFSLAFWLKTNYIAAITSYFRIVAWDNADSYDNLFFELHSDSATWGDFDTYWSLDLGHYDEEWDYSGLNILIDPDVHPWTDGVLHFVCIIYDGSGLYLYVDNSLWGSAAGTHGMTAQPDRLLFGESRETAACNWSDEVAVYENHALTSDERDYLYNGGAGRALY
jgi:hypothetical protein